jgi:hypothetical protein
VSLTLAVAASAGLLVGLAAATCASSSNERFAAAWT